MQHRVFERSAKRFQSTIAKKAKYKYNAYNITSIYQLRNKIRDSFRNSDDNDINLIYIACHGAADYVQVGENYYKLYNCDCGICNGEHAFCKSVDLYAETFRRWCDRYIRGKTIIVSNACDSGAFAANFMKTTDIGIYASRLFNYDNTDYTYSHYAFMTSTGVTESWTSLANGGTETYWFDIWNQKKYLQPYSNAVAADKNQDHKITLKELYDYAWPRQYEYDKQCCILYNEYISDEDEYIYPTKGVLLGSKAMTSIVLYKYSD